MSYLDDIKWDNGEGVAHFSEMFNTINTFAEYIFNETSQLKFWGNPELNVQNIYYMSAVIMNYTDDLKKCIDRLMKERESE